MEDDGLYAPSVWLMSRGTSPGERNPSEFVGRWDTINSDIDFEEQLRYGKNTLRSLRVAGAEVFPWAKTTP
jgi:hypothetical protein